MGLLVFVAVAAAVVATPLISFLVRSRLRPGATKMILVGAASGEAEKELWLAALRSAGIRTHISNVGDITPYYGSGPRRTHTRSGCRRGMRRGRARCWGSRLPRRLNQTFTLVKTLFTEVFTVVGDTVSHDA